jgi:hypothetical protein
MPDLVKDTLSEAQKGQKLVKELMADLYYYQIADEGSEYNLAVQNAYGSVCRALMDIETAQNASINNKPKHLNSGGGCK